MRTTEVVTCFNSLFVIVGVGFGVLYSVGSYAGRIYEESWAVQIVALSKVDLGRHP